MAACRLDKVKDVKTMIDSIALLKNLIPLNLKIYGKGPLLDELTDYIQKKDCNKIITIINYKKDLVFEYLNSDVYLNTSLNEYNSISIIEALSFANCIIATNVGGNPEIINDKINGILIDKNNPYDLAMEIFSLHNNRKILRRLSENGRKTFEKKFSMQIFYENTISAIKNLYEI